MTDDTTYDELLEFAKNLATEAGVIMRDYFQRSDKQATLKADKTIVTEADRMINDLVIAQVQERFPKHGVLGEEASIHTDRRELWVCDPIDGTNGFVTGEPTSVFSLAYVVDGKPVVAVTFDPYQERLYWASEGNGAYCNGERLRVSDRPLSRAYIAGPGSFGEIERTLSMFQLLKGKGARIRMFGGLVFKGNLIAEGRMDGLIFPFKGAHDIAAVKLIVEEAGGKVTAVDGEEQPYNQPIRGAVVSNGLIHDELLHAVGQFGHTDFLSR